MGAVLACGCSINISTKEVLFSFEQLLRAQPCRSLFTDKEQQQQQQNQTNGFVYEVSDTDYWAEHGTTSVSIYTKRSEKEERERERTNERTNFLLTRVKE